MNQTIDKKKWQLTFCGTNTTLITHEEIKNRLTSLNLCFYCLCDEIGNKTQGYHTHLFIIGKQELEWNQIKTLFPSAHIEACRGTIKQNINYIKKEGITKKENTNLKETYEEWGFLPSDYDIEEWLEEK